MIESRWTTMSINFAYLTCPTCKKPMSIHPDMPVIGPLFQAELDFQNRVKLMAMREAPELRMSARLRNPNDECFGDFGALALASCTFYLCQRCHNPYFGGMIDCG